MEHAPVRRDIVHELSGENEQTPHRKRHHIAGYHLDGPGALLAFAAIVVR